MRKISTHLWFDTQAREAAAFYTSVFADSRIKSAFVLENTPSGDADLVTIDLAGSEFMLISAGPLFKFNPSVSFSVACPTVAEADTLWERLSAGGTVLMEFGEYPFSERFGWTADKYGLSWQIMHTGDRPVMQKITPMLLFTGARAGKAEEAINFYASVFRDAAVHHIQRRAQDEGPDAAGTVAHASFQLEGSQFAAMDSAHAHDFTFNEAISFVVTCDTQAEIDYYWGKLSADPAAEQCGWLKDKYTVSWQIVPRGMDAMLQNGDKPKIARVTAAFLQMKKFDIAALERAAAGL